MVKAILFTSLVFLTFTPSASAGPDEPLVWPVVRYGWPEKLSAGVAIQPRSPGALLVSFTVGAGGMKGGVGIGTFGTNCMIGAAIQVTLLRTGGTPLGAPPRATFVGAEAEVMGGNISLKVGPAFQITDRAAPGGRWRVNFGVGYGF